VRYCAYSVGDVKSIESQMKVQESNLSQASFDLPRAEANGDSVRISLDTNAIQNATSEIQNFQSELTAAQACNGGTGP
jgi:hypothetical protein